MEIQGKITKIFDTQTFGSGFTKREVIVTTQEQYPQPISVEFLQDKVSIVDNLKVGDDVNVSINLRGREWTAPDGVVKYFNSIVGWRVEKINTQEVPANTGANQANAQKFTPSNDDVTNEDGLEDDLPF